MEKTDHNMTQFIDKIMENVNKLIKVYKKMQKTAKRKNPSIPHHYKMEKTNETLEKFQYFSIDNGSR